MDTFGANTKKLGFGMMRLPELSTSGKFGNIDIDLTKKMVDYFISEGFTYFDTAWMYCGFKSEDAAGEALVSRHNRNEFTLATKLHSGFFNSEEGRALMKEWGVPDNYICQGFVVLGYIDGEQPVSKPRKPGRVQIIE